VKLVFSHSKLRKQPFLLKISKLRGASPSAPLPTSMFVFVPLIILFQSCKPYKISCFCSSCRSGMNLFLASGRMLIREGLMLFAQHNILDRLIKIEVCGRTNAHVNIFPQHEFSGEIKKDLMLFAQRNILGRLIKIEVCGRTNAYVNIFPQHEFYAYCSLYVRVSKSTA